MRILLLILLSSARRGPKECYAEEAWRGGALAGAMSHRFGGLKVPLGKTSEKTRTRREHGRVWSHTTVRPTPPRRRSSGCCVSAALHRRRLRRRRWGARAVHRGRRVHNITRLTATGGGGGRAADPAVTAAAYAVGDTTLFYELRRLSNASALDRAGAARILAQVAHIGGPGFSFSYYCRAIIWFSFFLPSRGGTIDKNTTREASSRRWFLYNFTSLLPRTTSSRCIFSTSRTFDPPEGTSPRANYRHSCRVCVSGNVHIYCFFLFCIISYFHNPEENVLIRRWPLRRPSPSLTQPIAAVRPRWAIVDPKRHTTTGSELRQRIFTLVTGEQKKYILYCYH